jgi:hypothetical protein
MALSTLRHWSSVMILGAEVVFDKLVYFFVSGLETHVEGADGVVVCETVFKDRLGIYRRVTVVTR